MDQQQTKSTGHQGKLELIATQQINANGELYKIVDFLNKNLKNHKLMFGLAKRGDAMIVSIYEVE